MGIGEPTGTKRNADGDLIGNRLFPVRSPMGTKCITDGDQKNSVASGPIVIRIDARAGGIRIGCRAGLVGGWEPLDFLANPRPNFETHERAGASSQFRSVSRCSGASSWRRRQKPTKAAAGLWSFGLPELTHQSRQSRSRP
jgi:hypothetical protein